MKLRYTLYSLAAAALFMTACTSENDAFNLEDENNAMHQQKITFPEDDGSKTLTGRTYLMVRTILQNATSYEFAKTLAKIEITEEQYNEIAAFTDELVSGKTTNAEKYTTVFKWITSNVKYAQGWVDNAPYAVFKNKEAICQGYADLLTVMMHSQGIPCFTINGELYNPGSEWYIGGHAWNYVYTGEEGTINIRDWYVSDPTNNGSFKIASQSSYAHLRPTVITIPVYEDENFQYNFEESQLNVYSIKSTDAQVVIPYSINKLKITSLNIKCPTPDEVKEIYIGKNITSLGNNFVGLSVYAAEVEQYHIDPENTALESFSNAIYKKNGSNYELYLIAPKATSVELKPIASFDKESKLKNLNNLETVVFVPGTKSIGAWAVENCPKLHTAYIPEDTKVDSGAFTGVASNFKIVRGNYTNIPQIKY